MVTLLEPFARTHLSLEVSDHSPWLQKEVQLLLQVLALQKSICLHTRAGVQKPRSLPAAHGMQREELRA